MGETALHLCCYIVDNMIHPHKFELLEERLHYVDAGEENRSEQSSQPAASISWNDKHVILSPNNSQYEEFESQNLEIEIPQVLLMLLEQGADISIRNKVHHHHHHHIIIFHTLTIILSFK